MSNGVSYKECSHCYKMYDVSKDHNCKEKEQHELQRKKHLAQNKRMYAQKNAEITRPLQTKRWKELRKRIILADKGRCQRCLLKYGLNNYDNLEIHHIKPRIEYPNLMFEENNLVTLCHTCNAQLALDGIDFDWSPNDRQVDHDYRFF